MAEPLECNLECNHEQRILPAAAKQQFPFRFIPFVQTAAQLLQGFLERRGSRSTVGRLPGIDQGGFDKKR